MLAVLYQVGFKVPTSVSGSIVKNTVQLLIAKNALGCDEPIVGQLIKKMARLEMNGTVPIKIKQIKCYIIKGGNRVIVFYYIENVPLLMEQLVAGCLLEGKYEDSFKISKVDGKVIFKIGANCGGGDLINETAIANRHKGNIG